MNRRYFFENIKKKFQINRVVPIIVMIIVLGLSIGYSAFSSNLNITGIVSTVRIKKDIRVTGVNVVPESVDIVNNGGSARDTEYNVKSIYSTINLPNNNSSITFNVEITNIEAQEMGILEITGLPDNLDYELLNYNLKDKICDDTGKCNLGIKKYIKIKIKYKDNGYDSTNTLYNISPVFNFQPIYTITYTGIENNNYPTEIIGGDTFEINLGNSAPRYIKVLVNQEEIKEGEDISFGTDISLIPVSYTYSNGLLTIYNINGNIEIKDAIKTVSSDNGTIVLNDVNDTTIESLTISGNSIQDGTPTPDTPIEIESVGERTKNVLKLDEIYICGYAGDYYPSKVDLNNKITSHFTESSNYQGVMWLVKVQPNTTYTFSTDMVGDKEISVRGAQFTSLEDAETYQVITSENKIDSATFTTNADTEYILIGKDNTSPYPVTLSWTWAQLEEGTEATEYEPYGYKIPVKVSGNNLWEFDFKEYSVDSKNTTYTFSKPITKDCTFSYRANNYTSDRNVYIIGFIKQNSTTYVYPNHIKNNNIININSSEENPLLSVQVRNAGTGYISGGTIDNFMLVEGTYKKDTMPDYEPYQEPITTNIYLDEPLRKIEEYADYIDFKNQKVFRNVEVIDDSGTLTIEESYKGIIDNVGTYIDLPNIQLLPGYSRISVDTKIAPSNIEIMYK